jgi:hypothetical protein
MSKSAHQAQGFEKGTVVKVEWLEDREEEAWYGTVHAQTQAALYVDHLLDTGEWQRRQIPQAETYVVQCVGYRGRSGLLYFLADKQLATRRMVNKQVRTPKQRLELIHRLIDRCQPWWDNTDPDGEGERTTVWELFPDELVLEALTRSPPPDGKLRWFLGITCRNRAFSLIAEKDPRFFPHVLRALDYRILESYINPVPGRNDEQWAENERRERNYYEEEICQIGLQHLRAKRQIDLSFQGDNHAEEIFKQPWQLGVIRRIWKEVAASEREYLILSDRLQTYCQSYT